MIDSKILNIIKMITSLDGFKGTTNSVGDLRDINIIRTLSVIEDELGDLLYYLNQE